MNYAASLRREISGLARAYARRHGLEHATYESLGGEPTVMFKPFGEESGVRRHPNFLQSSYAAIAANDAWYQATQKRHRNLESFPPHERVSVRECDSSNSSCALLLNVFANPATQITPRIAHLFGLQKLPVPEFEFKPLVPLQSGSGDNTHVDMHLPAEGGERVIVEAKLTEADFGNQRAQIVESYRDFDPVFARDMLRRDGDEYADYQLIRNVLAGHHLGAKVFVLLDARRPDLLQAWWRVMRAVRLDALRGRCGVVTWQQIEAVAPYTVRTFMCEKYGIGAFPPAQDVGSVSDVLGTADE